MNSNQNNLSGLQYSIYPSLFKPGALFTSQLNQAFSFWKNFWIEVFRENGVTEEDSLSTFCQAHSIGVLTHEEKIVGVHLYTIYNLESLCSSEHPYFVKFRGDIFYESLKKSDAKSALSLGYLAIHPMWRKFNVGVSLGSVMISLGTFLQKHLSVDGTLGRCRTDVKTNRMLMEVGGTLVEKDFMMHNTPCDFIIIKNEDICNLTDPEASQLVHRLWDQRKDFFSSSYLAKIDDEFRIGDEYGGHKFGKTV